jgi:hypothetical protein
LEGASILKTLHMAEVSIQTASQLQWRAVAGYYNLSRADCVHLTLFYFISTDIKLIALNQ